MSADMIPIYVTTEEIVAVSIVASFLLGLFMGYFLRGKLQD